MNNAHLRKLVLAATFSAIIFLGTFLIKFPIPNGYIHVGDGFIYIAAALLPLPHAMAAAALAGLLADLISGFAAYAPFTALVKLTMALLAAVCTRRSAYVIALREHKEPQGSRLPCVIASVLGGIANVVGYFATDCILYGLPAAISTLPMNLVQSAFGVVVFLIFLPIFAHALKRFHRP